MPFSASPINSLSPRTSPFSPPNTKPLESSLKTLELSPDLQQRITKTAAFYIKDKNNCEWTKAGELKPGSLCAIRSTPKAIKMAIATDRVLGEGAQGRTFLAQILCIDRLTGSASFSRPKALIEPFKFGSQQNQQRLQIHKAVHPSSGVAKPPKPVTNGKFFLQYGYDGTVRKGLIRIDAPEQTMNPLSLEERLDILIDVADGLQAIHERGFYHQDVHADNVMLELKEKKIKAYLNDFDLSQPRNITNNIATPQWHEHLDTCSQNGFRNTIATDIYELAYLTMKLLDGFQTPFFLRSYHQLSPYELPDFFLKEVEKLSRSKSLSSVAIQVLKKTTLEILCPVLQADWRLTRYLRDHFCIPLYVDAQDNINSVSKFLYEAFHFEPLQDWFRINQFKFQSDEIRSLKCEDEIKRREAKKHYTYYEIDGNFAEKPLLDETEEQLTQRAEELYPSAKEIGDALRSIRKEFFPPAHP